MIKADPICHALVAASDAVAEIVGELHALHYYGRDMNQHRRERMIREAREMAEKVLAAVIVAENFVLHPEKVPA